MSILWSVNTGLGAARRHWWSEEWEQFGSQTTFHRLWWGRGGDTFLGISHSGSWQRRFWCVVHCWFRFLWLVETLFCNERKIERRLLGPWFTSSLWVQKFLLGTWRIGVYKTRSSCSRVYDFLFYFSFSFQRIVFCSPLLVPFALRPLALRPLPFFPSVIFALGGFFCLWLMVCGE